MNGARLLVSLIGIYIWLFPASVVARDSIVISTYDTAKRSFTVDEQNNQFLMDGNPFRYIAGSFHYFRSTPETWRRKIKTMKAAGLNAVSTYVEWSTHNPVDNDEYVWTGVGDLDRFLDICKEEGMFVLLRPGPYICAERDLGGFPWWLLRKYPRIKLRTTDANFMQEVRKWLDVLMPRMKRHLYGQGGNIILVQVENEYGSFGCDHVYTAEMKSMLEQHVGNDAPLYTTDGPADSMLRCGHVNGTVQSIDFGAGADVKDMWRRLRKHYPNGPLINSEFYVGWLTHWSEKFARVGISDIVRTLDEMLSFNANVNLYMFYGGTNFGFTNGANLPFMATITSYDYDAPMSEAGDPNAKYWAIRNITSKYVTITEEPPQVEKKFTLHNVTMRESGHLLDARVRQQICQREQTSREPLSFEELGQNAGLVIYEVPSVVSLDKDPNVLRIKYVRDRAMVYVDSVLRGTLSRQYGIDDCELSQEDRKIVIVVENEGRVNYDTMDTYKGIRNVVINNHSVSGGWKNTGCPLDNGTEILEMVRKGLTHKENEVDIDHGPIFFYATFEVSQPLDTFLDLVGWGKGVAYMNGINLGRYWPKVGPQRSLYVPKEFLKPGTNELVLLEYEQIPPGQLVSFLDHAVE